MTEAERIALAVAALTLAVAELCSRVDEVEIKLTDTLDVIRSADDEGGIEP
jgi:hypothetical protein